MKTTTVDKCVGNVFRNDSSFSSSAVWPFFFNTIGRTLTILRLLTFSKKTRDIFLLFFLEKIDNFFLKNVFDNEARARCNVPSFKRTRRFPHYRKRGCRLNFFLFTIFYRFFFSFTRAVKNFSRDRTLRCACRCTLVLKSNFFSVFVPPS